MENEKTGLEARIQELEATNKGLLAALDGLLFAVYEPGMRKEALDIARATIAKAKEEEWEKKRRSQIQ